MTARVESRDTSGAITVTETDEAMAAVAMRQGISVQALRSRLVEVAETFAADPSRCSFCEGPLPAGGRSQYCEPRCRKAASRERRTEARS